MNSGNPTNETRAGRAESTLRAYAKLKREVSEPENDLVDLLADLMHFAGQRGVDFKVAQATAMMHFEAETEEASVADWGMKCPDCGRTGPFRVAATSVFVIDIDGTEEHGDVEYDGGSYCECEACEHSGIVSDFRTA